MADKTKNGAIVDLPKPAKVSGGNPAASARGDDAQAKAGREADRELDEALEDTFPASDPVAAESTLVSGRRR